MNQKDTSWFTELREGWVISLGKSCNQDSLVGDLRRVESGGGRGTV